MRNDVQYSLWRIGSGEVSHEALDVHVGTRAPQAAGKRMLDSLWTRNAAEPWR